MQGMESGVLTEVALSASCSWGADVVGRVAERLEVQRQALVDLEVSILEAQKEVRCW
jgi:hypothetical protein